MKQIAWRYSPQLVEDALAQALPEWIQQEITDQETGASVQAPLARLRRAMREAVFGGGKRLRSQLVLEAAGVVGGADFAPSRALPAACALEMIHAYSLVHDDLPAMDNADTRRGRPSSHRAYDEATAILVGDGLLTQAFEIVAAMPNEPASTVQALRLIAEAAGDRGMVGGQAIDIRWSDEKAEGVTGEALLQMHSLKTGALIRCSCEVGAVAGGGTVEQVASLRRYGIHLGRAFQIQDDVLDVEGDPDVTGKNASDVDNFKITAPALFGLEAAKTMAREAAGAAQQALRDFGPEADNLRELAHFVVDREQ